MNINTESSSFYLSSIQEHQPETINEILMTSEKTMQQCVKIESLDPNSEEYKQIIKDLFAVINPKPPTFEQHMLNKLQAEQGD